MAHTSLALAALVLFVGSISYMLGVFSYSSPPVVALDVMNTLGLNPDQLSLMFAATMAAYSLMQPVSGFCADRFGPRRCLVFASVLLGLGSLLFSQTQGVLMGGLTRAMIGVAAGLTLMPCLKLAGYWFNHRYFGLVSSVVIAFSAIGNGMAGRPLAWAATSFGWRDSFAAVGVFGLIWSVFIFAVVRDRPKGIPAGTPEDDPILPPPQPPARSFFKTLAVIVKIPAFWLLGFTYAGTDMIYCTFNTLWVGPYMMEVHELSEAVAGNLITLAAVSYFIGPPLITLWGGAWGYSKVILTVALFNCLLGLFLLISPSVPGVWVLYIFCFLSPVGAMLTVMILSLGRDLVPENIGGSAMGFLNLFPIAGGAIMQKVVGRLLTVDEAQAALLGYSELYSAAFRPMMIYMLITVVMAYFLVRRYGKKASHQG